MHETSFSVHVRHDKEAKWRGWISPAPPLPQSETDREFPLGRLLVLLHAARDEHRASNDEETEESAHAP